MLNSRLTVVFIWLSLRAGEIEKSFGVLSAQYSGGISADGGDDPLLRFMGKGGDMGRQNGFLCFNEAISRGWGFVCPNVKTRAGNDPVRKGVG